MSNPLSLAGRSILVTGASSGLGLGISRLLAELGAKVILAARDAARLETARASLAGVGHAVEPVDLSRAESIPQWMRDVTVRHGPLHGAVHSAGIMVARPLRILTPADWTSSMSVNVVAASALAKGFRQKGVNADGGSIVFLASVTGLAGHSAQSLYGATKGAVIAMAKSLAVELAPEGIRVNCVAPALVDAGLSTQIKSVVTPAQWDEIVRRHPLGLGRPEDVAGAVAFLLAKTGRWITGTTLVVDGGYTAQ